MITFLKKYITFHFCWKNGLYFFIVFIFFTVIGTLSHEAGHYLVAKKYFKNPSLHYGYVSYGEWKKHAETKVWVSKHSDSTGYVAKEHYKEFKKYPDLRRRQSFYATMGGPIQTILFGTIGWLFLYLKKRKKFKRFDWLAVFLGYFWSREVFIFLSLISQYIQNGNISIRCDEVKIAHYLHMPLLLPAFILATLGSITLIYITFVKIPMRHRFTFIVSGIAGSMVGFVGWLKLIGPLVLP